jgi:hypothetical protein
MAVLTASTSRLRGRSRQALVLAARAALPLKSPVRVEVNTSEAVGNQGDDRNLKLKPASRWAPSARPGNEMRRRISAMVASVIVDWMRPARERSGPYGATLREEGDAHHGEDISMISGQ